MVKEMCLWDVQEFSLDVQEFSLDVQTMVGEQVQGGVMTRKTTKRDSPERSLSPEQELCLLALLEGATDQAAGERAGVSRSTVARWRAYDAVFVARLNEGQRVLWDSHVGRLLALQAKALDVVSASLDSVDSVMAFRAAVQVLRLAGERPKGPTSEVAVLSAMALDNMCFA